MSISKEIISDFNLYYKFANAYVYNLGISNSNFPLSLFKKDLKRFDIVSNFFADVSGNKDLPLDIKNHIIVLSNCFGLELVEEALTLEFNIFDNI